MGLIPTILVEARYCLDGMTHKKNFGSPLITALTSASLSVGFFGIGLQKAKGSQQASLEVR